MSTENYSFINPTRIIETAMDSSNLSPLPLSAVSILNEQVKREAPSSESVLRIEDGLATIPRFEAGTKGRPFEGGLAIVGEKGQETVTTASGETFVTPNTETLVNLPPGSQVIPHSENKPASSETSPGKISKESANAAESKAEKPGFFSRLFGGSKEKKGEAPGESASVKTTEPKAPKYRVVGEVKALPADKSLTYHGVKVDFDLEKETDSKWNYLAGSSSEGDIETAYRQAAAILQKGDLKNYPEAANVKIPSPSELVGYDKIDFLNKKEASPSESKPPENIGSKLDKPIVWRVDGDISEVTGISSDRVAKQDFSPRYEVSLWGSYYDAAAHKLRETDIIYSKESKSPEEAYSSAEENFLKVVTLSQKPAAKIPALKDLDGYFDVDREAREARAAAIKNTPAKTVGAQTNEIPAASKQKSTEDAVSKPSASVATAVEDPSKLSDAEFNELAKMQKFGETEKLVQKSADLSKRLKGNSQANSQKTEAVPTESVANDLATGQNQSAVNVSSKSVATDFAAKSPEKSGDASKPATPAAIASQAASQSTSVVTAATQPESSQAAQPDEFTKFLIANRKSITPEQVKSVNEAKTKAAESDSAAGKTESDKSKQPQPGNQKPSQTVSAESVATAFSADGETTAEDLALEAYLNSGFTDADVKGMQDSLTRSQGVREALNNRPQPVSVPSESIANEIAKSPSATLGNQKVPSESIASTFTESKTASPSTNAGVATVQEDPSKLSDAEFNELVKMQKFGETEKLVQKSADLSKRLKGQGPSLPSESVASAFVGAEPKKEESIASTFTTQETPKVAEQSIATSFAQSAEPVKAQAPSVTASAAAAEPALSVKEKPLSTGSIASTEQKSQPTVGAVVSAEQAKSDSGKYEIVGSVNKLKGDNVRLELDLINKETGKSVVGTGSSGRPLAEAYADASKSMNARLAERGLSTISIPEISKLNGADSVTPKAETTPAGTLNTAASTTAESQLSEAKASTKKSKGFFGKIKSLFTGSDDETKPNTPENKENVGPGSKLGDQFGEKKGSASAETIKNTFGLTLEEQKRVNSGEELYQEDEDSETAETVGAQPSAVLEKQNSADLAAPATAGEVNISNVLSGESQLGAERVSKTSTVEPEVSVQGNKPLNRGLANAVLNPPNPVKEGIDNLTGVVQSSSSEMTAGVSAAVTGAVSSIPAAMTASNNYSTINNTNAGQQFDLSQAQPLAQAPSPENKAAQPTEMTSDHYIRLLYEAIVTHGVKLRTI